MLTDISEMSFFAQSCNRHLPWAIFSSQGFLPPASVCSSPLTHGIAGNPWREGPEEVLGSAALIHSFEEGSTPLTVRVPQEHLISKAVLVTGVGKCHWQGTRQGQRGVSWLRHQVGWEGAGFWHCCLYHRVPASGCHFVASCSNAGTCLVFWISKSTPGATWSFKASFRWFALRNSIKDTTTIKE